MDIRQLEYFLSCAEHRNFSQAADELFTSQPHVSMVISSLEKELGYKLFERTYNGVALTPAGSETYEHALNMINSYRLMQDVSTWVRSNQYTVYSNPSSNMAHVFSQFYNHAANEHYHYYEAGTERIIEKVAMREAEIGFVFVPINKSHAFNFMLQRKRLAFTQLRVSDLCVCVDVNNPIAQKDVIALDEISDLKFVQSTDDFFSVRDMFRSALTGGKNIQFNNVIMTNSVACLVQLMRNSGLSSLSSYWLKNNREDRDSKMIPVEGLEKTVSFGYIHARDENLSERGKLFVSYVQQRIEADQQEKIS